MTQENIKLLARNWIRLHTYYRADIDNNNRGVKPVKAIPVEPSAEDAFIAGYMIAKSKGNNI